MFYLYISCRKLWNRLAWNATCYRFLSKPQPSSPSRDALTKCFFSALTNTWHSTLLLFFWKVFRPNQKEATSSGFASTEWIPNIRKADLRWGRKMEIHELETMAGATVWQFHWLGTGGLFCFKSVSMPMGKVRWVRSKCGLLFSFSFYFKPS